MKDEEFEALMKKANEQLAELDAMVEDHCEKYGKKNLKPEPKPYRALILSPALQKLVDERKKGA